MLTFERGFFIGAAKMIGENEELISLTAAAKTLPGRPSVVTLWRWRNRGVRGVKLETVLIGGRRYTSREALARFSERCTAAADGLTVPARSSRQRAADQSRAKAELAAAGIG